MGRPPFLSGVTTIAAVLAIWAVATHLRIVPDYVLARPENVLWALVEHRSLFARHLAVTAAEAGVGALFASVLGVLFGWAFAYSLRIERALSPFLVGSQVFPKEALAPLILILFGYGIPSKIVVSALLSFFPMCISTLTGARATPVALVDYGKSLGLSRFALFRLIIIPHSLPFASAALKVAFTLSIIGAIVGEFIGSQAGLGYLIRTAAASFATDEVYGSLVLLGILGGIFYSIAVAIDRIMSTRFPINGVAHDTEC